MHQLLFLFYLLSTVFYFSYSNASERTREPTTRHDTQREIKSASGVYTLDFAGITKLMDDLEKNDSAAFVRLKPHYDKIESDRNFYKYLGYGLAIGGGTALLFSKQIAGDNPTNAAAIGGGAALVGGVTTLFLLPPGEDRIEEFLNLYNRNTGSGLKMSIRFAPILELQTSSLAGLIRLTIF